MGPDKTREEPGATGQGRPSPDWSELALGKFNLGQIVQTTNSLERLHPLDVVSALKRHHQGDWGECGVADRQENERSLQDGERLFSVYRDRNGTKFWIITDAGREVTTILLPEDY